MKIIRAVSIMAIAAILVSCSVEGPVEKTSRSLQELTIEASREDAAIGEGPSTKTMRNEKTRATLWSRGDRISLFYGSGSDGGSMFTSTQEEDTVKITNFTGTIGVITGGADIPVDQTYFWALYPYDPTAECDGKSITFSLPSEQEAVPSTFANNLFPSMGKSQGLVMGFYNICGGFRFSVSKEGVKKATFRGNNGEKLTGRIKASMVDGYPSAELLDGEEEIVLTAPDGKSFEVGKYYYFVMAPTTFDSGFTVKVETKTEEATFEYPDAITVTRSNFKSKTNMDNGLEYIRKPEDIEAVDLSVNGTANCYIIPKQGKYKIKAVKGNSSESVGDVKGVKVLWESFGDDRTPKVGEIIKADASFLDGYIIFSTNDSYAEGNALIAAFSDEGCTEGNVLWSWHLWVTSADLHAAVDTYNNGVGTVMDRNLGALSSDAHGFRENSAGLLYQWGRKDPFLSSYLSDGSNNYVETTASVVFPEAVNMDSSTGTIEYSVKHPHTFIKGKDWLWNVDGQSDDSRWDLEKTVYDPCPPGYKIPDCRIWNVASGSFYYLYGFDASNYCISLHLSDKYVYYPYSKIRYYSSGQLVGQSNTSLGDACAYWGVPDRSVDDSHAVALFGTAYDRLVVLAYNGLGGDFSFKGTGNMVRCVSESNRPIVMPESLELDKYSLQIEPYEEFDLETLNPRIAPSDANVTSVRFSTSDSFNLEQLGATVIKGRNIGSYKVYCSSSLAGTVSKECSVIVCPHEPKGAYGGWYISAKDGDTISFHFEIGTGDSGENYYRIIKGDEILSQNSHSASGYVGDFSYTFTEDFTGWFYMCWGWGCYLTDITTTATVKGRGNTYGTDYDLLFDDEWQTTPAFLFQYNNHEISFSNN